MPLSVTVTPGKQFAEQEKVTYPKLNLLGTPNIFINGTVGTDEIGDSTVTAAKLENNINLAAKLADNSIPLGKIVAGDHGAVLYTDTNGDWAVLGPGSVGEFLQTNGAGMNPEWKAQTGISTVPISMIVTDGANKAITTDGSGAIQWEAKSTNVVGVLDLWEQQATNADAGASDSTTDQVRTLNQSQDPQSIMTSLSSNQFTLEAGTYAIDAMVPGVDTSHFVAWLYNATDASKTIDGTAYHHTSSDMETGFSHIRGSFTIAAAKAFEIRFRATATKATFGLGRAANISGHPEIYTTCRIMKLA